ncbi:MAG: MucB/RseB C-terminal domain-containing protein [Pseudomonadota bacterium]
MNILARLFGTFAGVLAFATLVTASPAPEQAGIVDASEPAYWLKRMVAGFREQDYDGILVANRGAEMRSMRIVHLVRDGQELERLQYLDGDPVEVIRASHPTDCVHAGRKLIMGGATGGLLAGIGRGRDLDFDGLYQLELNGSTHVAMRPVQMLSVIPQDNFRYKHQLYLDKESGLMLKSEVLDANNRVLETSQFIQIAFGDQVDPKAIEISSDEALHEGYHRLPLKTREPDDSSWSLAWLPKGFMQASYQRHRIGDADKMVQSRHFTDGISLFSVFVEESDTSVEPFETRTGSTIAYLVPKKLGKQWLSVTVVGEIPIQTAMKLTENLKTVEDIAAAGN